MKYMHWQLAILFFSLVPFSSMAQPLHLFNDAVRGISTRQQNVVMDFMESYFPRVISLGQAAMERQMADDKVFFRKGRVQDLYQLTDSMPVSLALVDTHYEVSWMKADKPYVTVVFPAQYELLMGMRQSEAMEHLKDAICESEARKAVSSDAEGLKEKGDGVYVLELGHFVLESLKEARYYRKSDDGFAPLFEERHKDYSAANLFQGLLPDADYRIYVEQSVYGMKTVDYTITLSQWLDYCASMNFKVYFAIEEEREDGILAIVLVHSKELGFNHMLSVVIPDNFIGKPDVVLKARLTPYIPTHNVKNLYQQQTKTKRTKWK